MTDEKSQEAFNMSMRKFLKQVGVTSQREIEKLVEDKGLAGKGKLPVKVVLSAEGTDLNHVVEGEIDLG
jgi:16S rRNA U516 pseudouridylate synthase RsuA-like enzyme